MHTQKNLIQKLQSFSDRIAIEENEMQFSFSELCVKSNQVTSFLLENEFAHGSRIGIESDSVYDMIVCILGIIQARCVFVPIDKSLPTKRLADIRTESEIAITIISSDEDAVAESDLVINLATIETKYSHEITELPDYNENDSLYIYFTSGSTGKPKGIIGKNSSLWNFVSWELETFEIKPGLRFSQLISPYFDAFLRDVFVPLLSGGTICVPPKNKSIFVQQQMIEWMDTNQISFVHCVPSVFRIMNNEFVTKETYKNLKYVLLSGERIVPAELEKWYSNFGERVQLVNLYGATEATMISSCYKIKPDDVFKKNISIGAAISNTSLVVLDEQGKLCKPLKVGELYIVTSYLTKGYLNNDKLNQEKFVTLGEESPFAGEKAFRTGDMARTLANRTIDLIGRKDNLIKLRGVRIELNEIENTLLKNEVVNQAVVLFDEEEDAIKAFVIPELNQEEKEILNILDGYLKEYLPSYMIPSNIFVKSDLPLLSNGKIDKIGLLNSIEIIEIKEPQTDIEIRILNIWRSILGNDQISVDQKFNNAGGNSLGMMRLMSALFSEFGVRVSLAEIFENFTIEEQGRLIENKKGEDKETLDSNPKEKLEYVKVSKSEESPYYPLSSAQKRLYFLQEFDEESLAYNITQEVKIEGKLNIALIEKAFGQLIQRHESLRTSFSLHEGHPVQKILEEVEFSIEFFETDEKDIKSVLDQFIRPFNLETAPLIRMGIIQCATEENILICDMHHIISDGISQEILIKDFAHLYNNEKLPALELSYKDYAVWQNKIKDLNERSYSREFWMRQFDSEIVPLNLPTDFSRPKFIRYEEESKPFNISKINVEKLRAICDEEGITMFIMMLSILNILLSKLSNQKDVIVGTNVAGRYDADLENIVGMFVNTLALRNYPKSNLRFKEFLGAVKKTTLEAFENQEYPFEELVGELNLPRQTNRNPLFDVMLAFQNYRLEELSLSELNLKPVSISRKVSKFDIEMIVFEIQDHLLIDFRYSKELFTSATIDRFIGYFNQIVDAVILNSDIRLSDISILSESERLGLLDISIGPEVSYPLERTFVDLFESVVISNSERIAVSDSSFSLSYGSLNSRSNELAHFLLSQGLSREAPVIFLCDRSCDYLVGMLGVFKSSGCYVPLSVDYPISRIRDIIEDTGCNFIITRSGSLSSDLLTVLLSNYPDLRVIYLDESPSDLVVDSRVFDISAIGLCSDDNPDVVLTPDSLAYILYTSGSTGVPKGVMIEHGGMLNHLLSKRDLLGLDSSSVVSQNASETFDISIWQFLNALLVGGKTVVYSKTLVLDPDQFLGLIKSDGVTILEVVPSYLSVLLGYLEAGSFSKDVFSGLSYLMVTGETLQKSLVERWFSMYPGIRMINAYGPTEASDDITHCVLEGVPEGATISIGSVIPNLRVYIVDEDLQLCPRGVKGEIVVSGIGVGRGYLNQPEKTSLVFIEDPFITEDSVRMYRTGDMGRWLSDGTIEFFGRKDNQVKVHGHRIELGEIESCLSRHELIREVVVLVLDRDGGKDLVCYYVSDQELLVSDLRSYLLESLPDYMVPGYYIQMDVFPLTINGKVDRNSLPSPEISLGDDYVGASTAIEEELVTIWSDVLGIEEDKIGVNTNFFDLGGDSMKVMVLKDLINQEFKYSIPIVNIFNYPTISALTIMLKGDFDEESLNTQVDEELAQRDSILNLINND